MDRKTTRHVVLALIVLSAQVLIFHDERTTAFYLLQDLAFMPVTIAIATLVVGELVDEREKKERLEKTKMLTSSFFTGIGAFLIREILRMTDADGFVHEVVKNGAEQSGTVGEIQRQLENEKLNVHIDAAGYTKIQQIIRSNQTNILVIASNPLIIEHECFSEMLWGVFHLMDEFPSSAYELGRECTVSEGNLSGILCGGIDKDRMMRERRWHRKMQRTRIRERKGGGGW